MRVADPLRAAALAPEDPGRGPWAEALRAAGVLDLPWLGEARRAVHDPDLRLEVDRGGRAGLLCLRGPTAVLLPPAEDGESELVRLAAQDVPLALFRLCAIRPRPLPAGADAITAPAAELAERIAAADAVHWRVGALHRGEAVPRAVEAVDGSRGWWLLEPGTGARSVTLHPVTATDVTRALARLLVPLGTLAA